MAEKKRHADFVQLEVPEEMLGPPRVVLEMVQILQQRGYPVRARATIGSNSVNWFCAVEQLTADQAKTLSNSKPEELWARLEDNWEGAFAQYNSKTHQQNFFGWKDTAGFSAEKLADRFLEKNKGFEKREATFVEQVYAKWLSKVLAATGKGVFYEHFGVGTCPEIELDIPTPLETLRSNFSADKSSFDSSKLPAFLA